MQRAHTRSSRNRNKKVLACSSSAASCCRRVSFLPLLHPAQRFSQRHDGTLQVLGPKLLPERAQIDDLLLAGRVALFVASSCGLAHLAEHVCPCCSHLGCGCRSLRSSPQTWSTSSLTPLLRRACKVRCVPASPDRKANSPTSSRTYAFEKSFWFLSRSPILTAS